MLVGNCGKQGIYLHILLIFKMPLQKRIDFWISVAFSCRYQRKGCSFSEPANLQYSMNSAILIIFSLNQPQLMNVLGDCSVYQDICYYQLQLQQLRDALLGKKHVWSIFWHEFKPETLPSSLLPLWIFISPHPPTPPQETSSANPHKYCIRATQRKQNRLRILSPWQGHLKHILDYSLSHFKFCSP